MKATFLRALASLGATVVFFPALVHAKPRTSSLSPKQVYLLRFKSIFYDLEPGDDWVAYRKGLARTRLPAALGPNAESGDPTDALLSLPLPAGFENIGDESPFEVDEFPLVYLATFHPRRLRPQKLLQLDASAKERLLPKARRRLWRDASRLSGRKRRFVWGSATLGQYDQEQRILPVKVNFDERFGFHSNVAIPLPVPEDYADFFARSRSRCPSPAQKPWRKGSSTVVSFGPS